MNPAAAKPRQGWRVVDIVTASVIAVASGVIFWAWSAGYGLFSLAFAAFPPAAALLTGVWLFPAVLGALIIRKPGAALYCELLAAVIEALLGSHYGLTVLISGLVQGLGAELVFAAFRYRKWNLGVSLLAGLFSGLFAGVSEAYILAYYVEYTPALKLFHVVATGVSGLVVAGLLSWLATRGLAKTGALGALASRRAHLETGKLAAK
ncbi:ECF transporter S component [Glutamicibacter sp. JL.03c]|uniref:ECF transporter S component n=1 Tax=Glutamicibacter sp. JL.03c TaxID=2984842 RepID=UPI0021F70427|nr:ECF transporter S component [Glutamicibacter sp. JL.03c]UYQ76766.1 ECF transporter S component [Glutamicibacter sp. JL.03c]